MSDINEDFNAFLAHRTQEVATEAAARETAYEKQERQNTHGGQIFADLFAQLDANSHTTATEPAPADPAEKAFNNVFGL